MLVYKILLGKSTLVYKDRSEVENALDCLLDNPSFSVHIERTEMSEEEYNSIHSFSCIKDVVFNPETCIRAENYFYIGFIRGLMQKGYSEEEAKRQANTINFTFMLSKHKTLIEELAERMAKNRFQEVLKNDIR